MTRETRPSLRFYRGGPDDHQRSLVEILAWDDARLEDVHDYVQWLFPLCEPSAYSPSAPTLGEQDIAAFRSDPELRARLRAAFERRLAFYGLEQARSDGTVRTGASFHARSPVWLHAGNHHLLRLTRILCSTRALGLEPECEALFRCLEALHAADPQRVGHESYGYWKAAARA